MTFYHIAYILSINLVTSFLRCNINLEYAFHLERDGMRKVIAIYFILIFSKKSVILTSKAEAIL